MLKERTNLLIKGLIIDWGKIDRRSYLKSIPAISDIDELHFNKPITFFVGENGSGKSTLLEAIAVAYGFNPEAWEGTRYHPERINYKDKVVSLTEEIAGEIVEMLIACGLTEKRDPYLESYVNEVLQK